MTRRLLLACATATLAGCEAGPGALKVAVSYSGPRDGCLIVRVAPTRNPSRVEERRLDKLPRLATRAVGVQPAASDGDAVTVVIEAHERGCEGPLVWRQEQHASAARPAGLIEAQVLVRDADDDTWADGLGSFVGGQAPGTDCDDTQAQIHPGAEERCNGIDDDCSGVRDDGLPQQFFLVDLDRDGWGDASSDAGLTACVQPDGFTADAGDCDDTRALVHPGQAEQCNGLDDDCDRALDEGFEVGAACDAGCGGLVQCTDAGAAFCAPSSLPQSWFLDADADGHGRADAGFLLACVQPEPGRIPNSDDCDDSNRFVHVGAREVCDGLDNDCDFTTAESCSDAGLRGFRRFPLPTSGAQWRAVAPFAPGFTWVVGESDQIVLRVYEPSSGTRPPDASVPDGGDGGTDGGDGGADAGAADAGGWDAGHGDGGFFNYSQRCSGNFRAAWAAPSGQLYLGEANHIDRLELDAGCKETWFDVQPTGSVTGISGLLTLDGQLILFVTTADGRAFRVADLGRDGGASSELVWRLDAGVSLTTVAALSRTSALVAGNLVGQGFFFAHLHPDGGFTPRTLPPAGAALPWVTAASGLSPALGYLAGNGNTLFRWDGQNHTLISGPGAATTHFSGLYAFGANSVVVVDTASRVWRAGALLEDGGTGAELWVDLAPLAPAPLRALGATAPDDVWVVGDNNNVLHFGD